MAVLIALVIAVVVSTLIFAIAETRRPATDVSDVGAPAAHAGAVAAREHPALERFLLARRDPTTETGLLLTVAVAFVAIAIFVTGSLLEMVNTHTGFARWDDAAARFGATHGTPDSTAVLRAITHLGSSSVAFAIVGVVGLIDWWLHRRLAVVAFLLTTVAATIAVNNITKLIVERQRPDIGRFVGAVGSSFPSGHTSTAAATYAAIALVVGRGRSRRARALLAAAAAAITLAVAASRVLLGVHWLTDVLAGILVGWSCFVLCAMAFGGRVMKFGQPVKVAQRAAETTDLQLQGGPR